MTMFKRFSDFHTMRSQLNKAEIEGIEFPPKALVLSDNALERRRQILQSFMNAVIPRLQNPASRRAYRSFFNQEANQTNGGPELVAVKSLTAFHGKREDQRLRKQALVDKQQKALVQKKKQKKTRENLGEGIKPTGLKARGQMERHRRAHEKKQRQDVDQQEAHARLQRQEREAQATAAMSRKAADDFHRTSYAPADIFSSYSSVSSDSSHASSTRGSESRERGENRNPQGKGEGDKAESLLQRWEAQKTLHSLLSSLHHVLPDRCRKFPNLKPESQRDELRKCYKKALRSVHPDKLGGVDEATSQRCQRVFVRLTAAHDAYLDAASEI
jgi:hypothetical protein